MPTYRNRSTGQTVTLDARSARLDRLSERWERTDDEPRDNPQPAAVESPPATPQPEKPGGRPAPRKSSRTRPVSEKGDG